MADIGVKEFLQNEIIEAFLALTSPVLPHLNVSIPDDLQGVYNAQRLEEREGYMAQIGPCIVVDMPVRTATESAGPHTDRITLSTNAYIYFSEQSDREADQFCSMLTRACTIALYEHSLTGALRPIGGYKNCFTVDEIGWGEYGQDKVFAFDINFTLSIAAGTMLDDGL